ncbi:hypothetical protein J7426_23015 [Tropicibacter sp. R16_0]|uniref:hypothetical protein n=1 Tax=Tropicibacter sp. R16_0 TaxID=2821102 RepID=UPI001AD981E9|nr:hypothetical protein [Tropicibacter sp. R16_0]MBO9453152.1 hypothetical protein [Tropicibacter sp. R16_0]
MALVSTYIVTSEANAVYVIARFGASGGDGQFTVIRWGYSEGLLYEQSGHMSYSLVNLKNRPKVLPRTGRKS